MISMDRRTFVLAGLALGSGAAAAPPASRDKLPNLFEQVVPKPTGQNGYEELVAAVEQLRSSKLFLQAEELMAAQRLSLSFQHRVLADPPVVRTRELLQHGLAKPVFSPRAAL